jgi:hypothetical protein
LEDIESGTLIYQCLHDDIDDICTKPTDSGQTVYTELNVLEMHESSDPLFGELDAIRSPIWSPNGQEAIYVADYIANDETYSKFWRLTPTVEGWETAELSPPAEDPAPGDQYVRVTGSRLSWSNNGQWLAYAASIDGSSIFYLDMATCTSDPTPQCNSVQVTSDPQSYDNNPDWSPDGTTIAFDSHFSTDLTGVYQVTVFPTLGSPIEIATPLSLTVSVVQDDSRYNDWDRGGRGWGSGPASIYSDEGELVDLEITDFQQNSYTVRNWEWEKIPETNSDYVSDGEDVRELDEATADIFLNWVYRSATITQGYLNRDWRDRLDEDGQSCRSTNRPEGCLDDTMSGYYRFDWMEEMEDHENGQGQMDAIFRQQNWKPTE